MGRDISQQQQQHTNRSLAAKVLSKPLRYCRSLRDWYVKSMLSCAASHDFSGIVSTPQMGELSRAASVSYGRRHDDYSELIRSASERAAHSSPARRSNANAFPRSVSVNVGKIDENAPCNFDPSMKIDLPKLPPRSHNSRTTFSTMEGRSAFSHPVKS